MTGQRVRGWRKLAGAAWGRPADPQFYGELDLDAAAMLAFVDHARQADIHLTLTHLVGRAVAHALVQVPELRVRIAHGREYPRDNVDVFFIVTADGGDELTGVKVVDADRKPAVEIAAELEGKRAAIDAGSDPGLGRTKQMLEAMPGWLLRPAIRLGAWLTSDLNLDLPRLGLPRQAFGSAMITSVGMWGVQRALSPLAGYYRVPVLVLVGSAEPRPVARSGAVVVRPMITLSATFDHRYVDGYHASRFAHAVTEYCANPAAFEPPLPHMQPHLPFSHNGRREAAHE